MMRRFSLSQRLTLLFILLMMLCAAVACAVQPLQQHAVW